MLKKDNIISRLVRRCSNSGQLANFPPSQHIARQPVKEGGGGWHMVVDVSHLPLSALISLHMWQPASKPEHALELLPQIGSKLVYFHAVESNHHLRMLWFYTDAP